MFFDYKYVVSIFAFVMVTACGSGGGSDTQTGPDNRARVTTVATFDIPVSLKQDAALNPSSAKSMLGFFNDVLFLIHDFPVGVSANVLQSNIGLIRDRIDVEDCEVLGELTVSSAHEGTVYTSVFDECDQGDVSIGGELTYFLERSNEDGDYTLTLSFRDFHSSDAMSGSVFNGFVEFTLNDMEPNTVYAARANLQVEYASNDVYIMENQEFRFSGGGTDFSNSLHGIECGTGNLYQSDIGMVSVTCDDAGRFVFSNSLDFQSFINVTREYTDFIYDGGNGSFSLRASNDDLRDEVYNFFSNQDRSPTVRSYLLNTYEQEQVLTDEYYPRTASGSDLLLELAGVFDDLDGDLLTLTLNLENVFTLGSVGENEDVLLEDSSLTYSFEAVSATNFIFNANLSGLYEFSVLASDPDGLTSEAFYFYVPLEPDLDGDSIYDELDDDIDGDLVENSSDAFPYDPSETQDFDSDGIGDNADEDIDGDNVANLVDVFPRNKDCAYENQGDGERCLITLAKVLNAAASSDGIVYFYNDGVDEVHRWSIGDREFMNSVSLEELGEFINFSFNTSSNALFFVQVDDVGTNNKIYKLGSGDDTPSLFKEMPQHIEAIYHVAEYVFVYQQCTTDTEFRCLTILNRNGETLQEIDQVYNEHSGLYIQALNQFHDDQFETFDFDLESGQFIPQFIINHFRDDWLITASKSGDYLLYSGGLNNSVLVNTLTGESLETIPRFPDNRLVLLGELGISAIEYRDDRVLFVQYDLEGNEVFHHLLPVDTDSDSLNMVLHDNKAIILSNYFIMIDLATEQLVF